MLTTPRINNFPNYSSIDGSVSNIFTFTTIGGDLVYKNELVIMDMTTNATVYSKIITSYKLEHTVIGGNLSNNNSYKARLRTYNQSNEYSAWSDWFIFDCFTTPTITFSNLDDGNITSQSYVFTANYHQFEGVGYKHYKFLLYDENKVLIESSLTLTDGLLSYHVTGFENLKNYFVEFQVTSASNAICTTGLQPVYVEYTSASTGKVLSATSNKVDGTVDLQMKVVDVTFAIDSGKISYYNDSWIDLTQGSIYTDSSLGLKFDDIWSIIFRLELKADGDIFKIVGDDDCLLLKKSNGYLALEYGYGDEIVIIGTAYVGHLIVGDEVMVTLQKNGISISKDFEFIMSERIAIMTYDDNVLISNKGDRLLITREGEIKVGRN